MRLPARSLVFAAAFAIAASAANATTIDFGDVSGTTMFAPSATYADSTATPFIVTNSGSTNWFLNGNQGHPPPGISTQAAGTSSTPYQLTISDGGGPFLFDSVDIGGFADTVMYSIDGYYGSTLEFADNNASDSNTGNVSGQAKYTTYNLSGIAGINSDITSLVWTAPQK